MRFLFVERTPNSRGTRAVVRLGYDRIPRVIGEDHNNMTRLGLTIVFSRQTGPIQNVNTCYTAYYTVDRRRFEE